jgi:thiosulfate dehydrogenase [quinone] large subunit
MNEAPPKMTGACASCISRRAFLADAATIAALTALFAACGDSPVEPPSGQIVVKVSDFPGLATMNQLVLVDGRRAAKRTGASSFVAFSRLCTHEGTPVDVSGSGFFCPNHGSQFDNDGQVTVGPATQPLATLATSFDATTGTLTIGA